MLAEPNIESGADIEVRPDDAGHTDKPVLQAVPR